MEATRLESIRGIGPARLDALNKAGITTLEELVMLLPKEYRDLSAGVPIASLRAGQTAMIRVTVAGTPQQRYAGRLTITKVIVTDGEEVLPVVWYNQPWLKTQLTAGRELKLYGKVEWHRGLLQMQSPAIENEEGIVPVYRTISGLPTKALRGIMSRVLEISDSSFPERLPAEIRRRYDLCERNFALRNAHFPVSAEGLAAARRRLAFEQLLLYQTALALNRRTVREGIRMDIEEGWPETFWDSLPFEPTQAQRRVLREAAEDMRSPRAMARMVQGDVGSGKTAIAFAAIYLAHRCGYQSALMAPTEVLARQHYDSARALLEPLGLSVGLLTGSLTAKQHRQAHEAAASGAWDVVIGTQALITENVRYARLGLVVTDEQHRFGVRQRTMLSEKGDAPNVLVMSATPIPRTLSLILYGDLDISIVDELPPGRRPVATRIVPEDKRADMYGFLRREAQAGRQIYVVCPLVEDSEAVDALAAEQVYEDLRTKHLPDLRIRMVHGRMSSAEKDEALEAFHRGEVDVLVSTTVIEVGVNVPNATIMVIENAERFGLAQLHQLRGRVGRGSFASWCFLMAEPSERLRFLTSTNDGFEIARKDMELRGPGELFGTRQSGTLAEGVMMLGADTQILQQTHDLVRELLARPESADAQAVIELAKERYSDKLAELALN